MEDSVCVGAEKTKEEDGQGEQEQAANLSAAFGLQGLRWRLVCDGGGRCVGSDAVL
jgi:ferredoxin